MWLSVNYIKYHTKIKITDVTTSIFIDLIQYNNRLQGLTSSYLKNKEKSMKTGEFSDV